MEQYHAIPANLKAATLLFFRTIKVRRALGGPHVDLRSLPQDHHAGPHVTHRCHAAIQRGTSRFVGVAGQLRVTLLVRLTQCVQPMVGVTRYDLPVVDVILERPFTIQDTQGAERLCSNTIGGRLSGHRIDAKNRPRGTGSLWMRCRSTGFHLGMVNRHKQQNE